MPSYIVKADPDTDLYIMWSTIVDCPVGWGSRADFANEDPARLERADRTGTSSHNGFYNWDDKEFYIRELGTKHEDYMLQRENLKAFMEHLDASIVDGNIAPEKEQEALDAYCTVWNPEDS